MLNSSAASHEIIKIVKDLLNNNEIEITNETPLIGNGIALDSMKLVELCLALEDLASDKGFEFDWTSDSAMSRSRGMFRSVNALAEEFVNQSKVAA